LLATVWFGKGPPGDAMTVQQKNAGEREYGHWSISNSTATTDRQLPGLKQLIFRKFLGTERALF
jgi:hypothetical protein